LLFVITSHHNPLLKEIRRLQARRDRGRFLAEGEDLVVAAEQAGWEPIHRLEAGVDVTAEALAKVSALGSGTRVLAVYEERWAQRLSEPAVALWGVGDPGNVGTVIRSALAFGAGGVFIGPGTADPYGPKAVRASMGAVFQVPLARAESARDLVGETIALVAHDGEALSGPGGGTLVVGAEREGLPEDVVAACDRIAHIPIASESLNAAMAASVALYERTRVP
jgi:TrmH family RNA methyltransferase